MTTAHNTVNASELKLEADLTTKTDRRGCYICQKPFTTFRRKHNCRVCGEVVCVNCTTMKPVADAKDNKQSQVKVCFWCPQRTRTASQGSPPMHTHANVIANTATIPNEPTPKRRMTLGEMKITARFWSSSRSA